MNQVQILKVRVVIEGYIDIIRGTESAKTLAEYFEAKAKDFMGIHDPQLHVEIIRGEKSQMSKKGRKANQLFYLPLVDIKNVGNICQG